MNLTCGCCNGIKKLTPATRHNRPGLSALSYRVGTHSSFFETMKARLSNWELPEEDVAAGPAPTPEQLRRLHALTTRASDDPSIALLDAWATVADVLTFYQERNANEGFLQTATERRSILELAHLIGYRLRPGVAASVFFAYALEKNSEVLIPAGARAQSVPGPGELPQPFETSEKLRARSEWGNLKPRLTRPQIITLNNASGTDAATRETIYFDGFSTKLTPGDAVLIRLSNDPAMQVLRLVETVEVQAAYNRTEIRLHQSASSGVQPIEALKTFMGEASSLFSDSKFARQVAAVLQALIESPPTTPSHAERLLRDARNHLRELHEVALKRKFTRLQPWLAEVLKGVETLSPLAWTGTGTVLPIPAATTKQLSSFGSLFALLEPLSIKPSIQVAGSVHLPRTSAGSFTAQSDLAPQLLTKLNSSLPSLYEAWANIAVSPSKTRVDAIRIKAGLFPGSYPGVAVTTTGDRIKTGFEPPTLTNSWPSLLPPKTPGPGPAAIALDGVYDKIQPSSWVAIDRPVLNIGGVVIDRMKTYHQITGVQTLTMATKGSIPATAGYTSRVTVLTLDPSWFDTLMVGENLEAIFGSTEFLHSTVVYAQAEPLKLAEEPLDRDIEGDRIELDSLYPGLDSGRWIIVSGERADIPNVSSVKASELTMLAGVIQGPPKERCVPFFPSITPFSSVLEITDPDANNDRFVIGTLSPDGIGFLAHRPPPDVVNQQYCEPVELAPGLFVDAYVPTDDEIRHLVPGPNSFVKINQGNVFGWRIKNPSGPPHTTLLLANKLAYSYDAATVTIYGNVVKATHGETKNEVLGSGDGSQELQRFDLRQSPLTYLSAPTPAGAESTLQVRVNDVLWHETETLVGAGPKDRNYITRTDDKDLTTVEFGNGEYGARLPTGVENVKAVYRVGIGQAGNVKAGQIKSVVTKPLGVKEVINPLPATGGANREGRDQARRNAPMAVMALDRLISVQDYEDFARTYAGIAKASSARLSDRRRQVVHLTIAGSDDIPIATTSDLFLNLRRSLRQFGDSYQGIQVVVRKLKLLVISARVRLLPDYSWEFVEPKIRAALIDQFGFARRELGQDALASEALSVMQAVNGVAYVDLDVFDAIDEDIPPQKLANLGSILKLHQRIRVNKAMIDKKASDPLRRILPGELAYLSPAVADTLILTEISA
jgi:hypothetical protein